MNTINNTGQNPSNMMNSINSMISNMDENKKNELMGMAKDMFSKMQ